MSEDASVKITFKRDDYRQLLRNARRAFKQAWQIDRTNLVLYFSSVIVQVATSLLAAYFAAQLLNALIAYLANDHASRSTVFIYLALGATMLTIEQLAWRLMTYAQNSSILVWHTVLSPIFYGKIGQLDIQRFEDGEYNKLLNKTVDGASWKPSNFIYFCYNTIHGLLRTASTATILVSFAPWLVPLLILAIVPSLLVEQLQSKVKWSVWQLKGDTSRRFSRITGMMQTKPDIMDMRLFGINTYLIDYCRRMLRDFNAEQQKALRHFITPALGVRLLEGLLLAGVQVWLVFKVLAREGFTIGQFSFYTGMVQQFSNAVGTVLGSLSNVMEYNLYMTDFYEVMDTPNIIQPAPNPIKLPKNTSPEIRFDNVSFRYPSSDKYVFKNLSLTIKPGERIALVGENGVGKSTLIKILLRFYDINEGTIYIDGYDVRKLDLDTWHRLVSVLFQDFSRYPFSVAENVQLGRIHQAANQTETEHASKLAGLDTVAQELPFGYDTILDNSFDKGVEPSGGQWQRVALARAFYRKASVLILDEPTAAIDAKAEYDIFNNIFREHTGKTAIIVSHRFSTVRKADRILVFEDGTITESGNHQSLMKQRGLYHELFTKQAEGYR